MKNKLSEIAKFWTEKYPDRDSLINMETGRLLTDLGRGDSIRSIVSQIILDCHYWINAHQEKEEKEEKAKFKLKKK